MQNATTDTPICVKANANAGESDNPSEKPEMSNPKHGALHSFGMTSERADCKRLSNDRRKHHKVKDLNNKRKMFITNF